THVAGLETNASFLHALASEPDFIEGDVSTRFIEEHDDALFAKDNTGPAVWAAAALWKRAQTTARDADPWSALRGFRLNRPRHEVMWIEHDGAAALLRLSDEDGAVAATLEPDASAAARREGRALQEAVIFSFSGAIDAGGAARISLDGEDVRAFAAPHLDGLRVWIGAQCWDVAFPDPLAGISAHQSSEGSLTAPMPGVVTLLSAKPGDTVAAGKPLLVMEAMKMEHAIKAPYDGVVKAYKFNPGDQVKDGDLLVEFEERA
ncbi:MAG: acyl-CoA carboxylase biotin carboxyl carrier protein subunit, partial [Hyphococcus sp.]